METNKFISILLSTESVRMTRYNLTWESFSEHLRLVFKNMFEDEKTADITLICDDQIQFKAHKIVLSACSPVFKKIIDSNPSQHPLIYLRGIQSYEMESILQFMYLGEAKFYYERMVEFINVANSLEVKEICQQKMEDTKEENEEQNGGKEKSEIKEETSKMESREIDQEQEIVFNIEENSKEEGMIRIGNKDQEKSSDENNDEEQEEFVEKHSEDKRALEVFENDKCDEETKDNLSSEKIQYRFQCSQCGALYVQAAYLKKHIKIKHENYKILCDQCDYQTGDPSLLKRHIKSIHEKVKYPCDHCEYQATSKNHVKSHIKSVHEKIKHPCTQCDFKAASRKNLRKHIQNIHEGKIIIIILLLLLLLFFRYQASVQSL